MKAYLLHPQMSEEPCRKPIDQFSPDPLPYGLYGLVRDQTHQVGPLGEGHHQEGEEGQLDEGVLGI